MSRDCIELGIKLVEPELEQAMLAAERRGALSFQDNMCLILAKENGWTCVTNDKPLRRECKLEGIPLIWGIQLICILVESGGLPVKHAKDIILEIQKNNLLQKEERKPQAGFAKLRPPMALLCPAPVVDLILIGRADFFNGRKGFFNIMYI